MPEAGFTGPTVYLFQALSPDDMTAWSDGFLAATNAAQVCCLLGVLCTDSTRNMRVHCILDDFGVQAAVIRSPQISGPTGGAGAAPSPSVNKMMNVLDSDDDDDDDDSDEDKL